LQKKGVIFTHPRNLFTTGEEGSTEKKEKKIWGKELRKGNLIRGICLLVLLNAERGGPERREKNRRRTLIADKGGQRLLSGRKWRASGGKRSCVRRSTQHVGRRDKESRVRRNRNTNRIPDKKKWANLGGKRKTVEGLSERL